MKTLSVSQHGNHCSEYFRFNNVLFKVVVTNGNSYFECNVYKETLNGDFALVACKYDIVGVKHIYYNHNDESKIETAKQNISIAKEWVRVIYTK